MVSIHAPVQGATTVTGYSHGGSDVSIHAPVQGATMILTYLSTLIAVFQSTHPYKVRLAVPNGGSRNKIVSIHAPVQGATAAAEAARKAEQVSIHAPVQGATSDTSI